MKGEQYEGWIVDWVTVFHNYILAAFEGLNDKKPLAEIKLRELLAHNNFKFKHQIQFIVHKSEIL